MHQVIQRASESTGAGSAAVQGMAWSECTTEDTQGAFESTRAGDGLDVLATQRASESTGLGIASAQGRAWHGVQALGCTEVIREH